MEITTTTSTTETTDLRIVDGPLLTDAYGGARFQVDSVVREVETFDSGEQIIRTVVKGYKVRRDGKITEQRSYQQIWGPEVDAFVAEVLS